MTLVTLVTLLFMSSRRQLRTIAENANALTILYASRVYVAVSVALC